MLLLRDEYLDSDIGAFESYRRTVNAEALRLGLIITVSVQVPFLAFEWLAVREEFLWVQALRGLWLGPALALYPLLKVPSGTLLRHVDGITRIIYVAAAAYIVFVAFLHEGYQSPYIHALVLMFVGVCAVMLWHLWFAMAFAIAVYGAYWTPLLFGYGSIANLTNWVGYQCFLIGTMGIVVVSQQLRLQMAQADFQRRSRLVDERRRTRDLLEHVETARQERLAWLENLARFLRHELKNQIVAVATSIDLAQGGESLDANRIFLSRAQRGLNRMRGLVSSATEATSLEAALAADEVDRVDLSALVADRVLTFQQLHPSRQVVLRPKPGLFVEGNEERLAQLLDKLLNNAVEHSQPDAEIHVTLRRSGEQWLELSVENEGDRLPEDKPGMFKAFASSQSRPENLGLGLFVAQSIARNHHGHITAEDLQFACGARFVVQLPEVREQTQALSRDESPLAPASEVAPRPVVEIDSAD